MQDGRSVPSPPAPARLLGRGMQNRVRPAAMPPEELRSLATPRGAVGRAGPWGTRGHAIGSMGPWGVWGRGGAE